MATDAVGFWSYVQQDNDGDQGRILALADDLREQYRLLTAEKLELFVDRESTWGEAWKERVDSAIAGTTFFIPIITPSYFRSAECRRELLKFAREAERLGLEQLLMSVYWVRVSELEDNPQESPDEAIRLVAKFNWQDLIDERLEERESSAYRKAVADLAAELVKRAELARQVGDVPIAVIEAELTEGPDDGGPGIIERLAVGEDAMPKATDLLQEIGHRIEEINERLEATAPKMDAAAKRGQGVKAMLTLTNKLAQELSQPAKELSVSGHGYGHVLAELDTGFSAQLDLIETTDPQLEVETNKDFLREIVGMERAAIAGQEGLGDLISAAEPVATFSRSLREPIENMRGGLRSVIDGNAVISEWANRARELLDEDDAEDEEDELDQ